MLDHYHYADFARKVVGVGSVGTEAFMVLLMGDHDDDPLFLQVKEADTSVLARVRGRRRIRAGGRARGSGPARHAGRQRPVPRLGDRDREARAGFLRPSAARHEGLSRDRGDAAGANLARYGELCGATLARAHARSGDAANIAGYLGDDDTFDRALEHFAVAYADQNDADYAEFTDAADEKRIAVERGV